MHTRVAGVALLALMALAASSPDAIVPDVPPAELLQAEVSMLAEASAASTSVSGVDGKEVVHAIVSLKAYCITMRGESMGQKKGINPVLALCSRLAAHPDSKDIVTEYGVEFGALTDSPSYKGVFKYVLNHLNDSILKGKSPVVEAKDAGTGKSKILSYENLGLRSQPKYIVQLKVPATDFMTTQNELKRGESGAAIANWIKTGKAHYYEEYLNKHMKNVNAIAASKEQKCNVGCVGEIKKAYNAHCEVEGCKGEERLAVVNKMSKACHAGVWESAPQECAYRRPSVESMKKEAMDQARAAMIKAARTTNEAIVIKELEEKAAAKNAAADKAAAAAKKKKKCTPAEMEGMEFYSWDSKGRYCYHVIAGKVVEQDSSHHKANCQKGRFQAHYVIGRGQAMSSHYPNGDSKSCPGGKKRSATLEVVRDATTQGHTAAVTEPSVCKYHIKLVTPHCHS